MFFLNESLGIGYGGLLVFDWEELIAGLIGLCPWVFFGLSVFVFLRWLFIEWLHV